MGNIETTNRSFEHPEWFNSESFELIKNGAYRLFGAKETRIK